MVVVCGRNLPVIVAEICIQCVQIETHSHGGAHQLRDHLSKSRNGKQTRMEKTRTRSPSSLVKSLVLLWYQFSRSAAQLSRQRRAFPVSCKVYES